jgi:CO dehydrogenase nickel-insertion accessory protein CooC1
LADLPENTRKEIEALPATPLALIPYDEQLVSLDLEGKPLVDISSDSIAYVAVKNMLKEIGVLD